MFRIKTTELKKILKQIASKGHSVHIYADDDHNHVFFTGYGLTVTGYAYLTNVDIQTMVADKLDGWFNPNDILAKLPEKPNKRSLVTIGRDYEGVGILVQVDGDKPQNVPYSQHYNFGYSGEYEQTMTTVRTLTNILELVIPSVAKTNIHPERNDLMFLHSDETTRIVGQDGYQFYTMVVNSMLTKTPYHWGMPLDVAKRLLTMLKTCASNENVRIDLPLNTSEPIKIHTENWAIAFDHSHGLNRHTVEYLYEFEKTDFNWYAYLDFKPLLADVLATKSIDYSIVYGGKRIACVSTLLIKTYLQTMQKNGLYDIDTIRIDYNGLEDLVRMKARYNNGYGVDGMWFCMPMAKR